MYTQRCYMGAGDIIVQDDYLILIDMNTENAIKSIYIAKKATPNLVPLPRIHKNQLSPAPSIFKKLKNKYVQNNIFKKQNCSKSRIKLNLAQQKMREGRERENDQLQGRMGEMIRKHEMQMRQIQQKTQNIDKELAHYKKQHYNVKLNLWEIKNDIVALTEMLAHQQQDYARLELIAQQQLQQQMQGQQFECEGNSEQRVGQDGSVDEQRCLQMKRSGGLITALRSHNQ